MSRTLPLALIIALLATIPAGCIDDDADDDDDVPSAIEKPEWQLGMEWTYIFSSPDLTDDVASTLVMADEDGTNYWIGVASLTDALRHAVLNFNPVLGRVNKERMGVYEKGLPQELMHFPLTKESEWSFSLLGVDDFNASVRDIRTIRTEEHGKSTIVDVEAAADSGETLVYSYDVKAGWLRSLVFRDANGGMRLEMALTSYGGGYSGEAYFVRATDLFYGTYSGTGATVTDTFMDSGHAKDGRFDYLVYYLEAETDDTGSGTMHLKDYGETRPKSWDFPPETNERILGTHPSVQGNWTLEVNLEGNSDVCMRIAGGIEYSWNV